MLSHAYLPADDVHLVRSVTVDAGPARTFEAIEPAQIGDDQLLAVATWLSELPEQALSFFQSDETRLPPQTTIGHLLDREGLTRLADHPGRELVVGATGRFWNPLEPLDPVDPEGFRTYEAPGSAKGVVSISLHDRHEGKCLLVLEARAKATDATGRRRLTRWANFVKPVAGLLARRALDVIKAEAEAEDGPPDALPDPTRTSTATASGLIPTLDDIDLDGRLALLRVDVNAPIEDGRVAGRERLQAAASAIQTLLDRGAGIAVLAHQGRPGREDFVDLDEHARILAELLDREVRHVEAVEDPEAVEAIDELAPGEVLVLGNVRRAPGEMEETDAATHARRAWVHQLAESVDVYVNDAFPACHRSHASIVGFPRLIPSAAGPGLRAEMVALDRVGDQARPRVAVLGGAKPAKSLEAIAHQLARDRVDRVLVGGRLAAAFLQAEAEDAIGQGPGLLEGPEAAQAVDRAGELLDTYPERIRLPADVALRRGEDRVDVPVGELSPQDGILDVGPETADRFATEIDGAGTVLVHGPMGVYEDPPFDRGTHRVFAAAAKATAYTVIGGGHTVHAMTRLGLDGGAFDHVSLAGGALLAYLAEETLPGIEALRGSRLVTMG